MVLTNWLMYSVPLVSYYCWTWAILVTDHKEATAGRERTLSRITTMLRYPLISGKVSDNVWSMVESNSCVCAQYGRASWLPDWVDGLSRLLTAGESCDELIPVLLAGRKQQTPDSQPPGLRCCCAAHLAPGCFENTPATTAGTRKPAPRWSGSLQQTKTTNRRDVFFFYFFLVLLLI